MTDSKKLIIRCDSKTVVSCEMRRTTTEDAPVQLDEILSVLTARPLEGMPKQTRWVVLTAKAPAGVTGDEIYDSF